MGELSLEEIEVTVPNCITKISSNLTNISESSTVSNISNGTISESCFINNEVRPDIENLENSTIIAPLLLAIYLLVGNVMLLNLLIAIFTSVFEEVHENSNEVWKWEMFRLLAEYDARPGLAPPLVIFEDVWRISKLTWKHTC